MLQADQQACQLLLCKGCAVPLLKRPCLSKAFHICVQPCLGSASGEPDAVLLKWHRKHACMEPQMQVAPNLGVRGVHLVPDGGALRAGCFLPLCLLL